MKLLFIVNPISGGVDKEPFLKDAKLLCDKYGISNTIFMTTGKNDKEEALKVIDKIKPDKIASVGGDGTTLFVATLLLHSDYPMGIIPLGSANGMATELFVNLNPIKALKDLILSEIVGGLDMLLINDKHHTLHIGDVGINARIVNSYEKDKNIVKRLKFPNDLGIANHLLLNRDTVIQLHLKGDKSLEQCLNKTKTPNLIHFTKEKRQNTPNSR